jgi:hypothetical protein
MHKRQIRITHSCEFTKGGYAGDPEYEAWMVEVRKAFAALGWAVTGQGPAQSSTHVEEDYLGLESDDGKLDPATLDRVLAQVGILSADYDGDVDGLRRSQIRRLPDYEENRRAAQRGAADLRQITPERGEPRTYTKLTLNAAGTRLDGFRFQTPEGKTDWDLHCEFVAPGAVIDTWGIAAREGEMPGFWFFRAWWDYQEGGAELPPQNRRIVPLLGAERLKPQREYVVWFTFPQNEPVDVHIRLGLTEVAATKG